MLQTNSTQRISTGKTWYCPVCTSRDQFLPFGDPVRQHARCGQCGALERHRLAWCYFARYSDLFAGTPKRMLHVAPEQCLERIFSDVPHIDYLSADIHPSKAMVKMDITDIQFPDNSFDVIYCSHVLEHVDDDRHAIYVGTVGGFSR